jgi:hypothetical protein
MGNWWSTFKILFNGRLFFSGVEHWVSTAIDLISLFIMYTDHVFESEPRTAHSKATTSQIQPSTCRHTTFILVILEVLGFIHDPETGYPDIHHGSTARSSEAQMVAGRYYVKLWDKCWFEVLRAMTRKDTTFWEVTSAGLHGATSDKTVFFSKK